MNKQEALNKIEELKITKHEALNRIEELRKFIKKEENQEQT